MTIKIRWLAVASLIASIITSNALAVNLVEVYKQALSSDPTFKAARAKWLADRETLNISRSALFPQLSANGGISRNYLAAITTSTTSYTGSYVNTYGKQSNYGLQLSQSIFDFGKWATIWRSQALAKKAEVTFLAAAESLLQRTAQAYFNVLHTKDNLSYAKANREALERMLNQTKRKYEVGLIAITALENDRASYDDAVAKEIAAENDVSISIEKLSEITGIRYLSLDPIKENFPLLSPKPTSIEKWARVSEQQNFDLAAARYATVIAREDVKIANAGHLPTLNANGKYNYNYYSNPKQDLGIERTKSASGELQLNLPLFQGGQVLAAAKQANYLYQQAIEIQETIHRMVVSSSHQAYLSVLSNISQIKANKQAIKSAQSSLRATIAGYEAGTQTMVEVLAEQSKVYNKQRDFANSEYDYINQLIKLKQVASILDENDLIQINSWLEKSQANNGMTQNRQYQQKHNK